MKTVVGINDPKAVKKYSVFLAVDVGRESYFSRKFMGVGIDAQTPIQILPHLENEAGDNISYDLVMQLKMQPVEGDNILENREEDLKFYSDNLYIDQLRGGVNAGGRMTRKRTIHDLRRTARVRQSEWWARLLDEALFMYLSGARGVNADFIWPLGYAGFAANAFVAPDSLHIMYGGAATTKATIAASDKFAPALIERAQTRASTMGGGTTGVPAIEPIKIDGEEHYVCCMHEFQAYDLRQTAGGAGWLDFQKAAAAAEGRNNPIFKGNLGMLDNTVLHKHRAAIGFTDYGAGGVLPARRALFMGRQAAVIAFGSEGGQGMSRFGWFEDTADRGNQIVITTSSILGIKKTAFSIESVSRDFGVIALDTYALDPN